MRDQRRPSSSAGTRSGVRNLSPRGFRCGRKRESLAEVLVVGPTVKGGGSCKDERGRGLSVSSFHYVGRFFSLLFCSVLFWGIVSLIFFCVCVTDC